MPFRPVTQTYGLKVLSDPDNMHVALGVAAACPHTSASINHNQFSMQHTSSGHTAHGPRAHSTAHTHAHTSALSVPSPLPPAHHVAVLGSLAPIPVPYHLHSDTDEGCQDFSGVFPFNHYHRVRLAAKLQVGPGKDALQDRREFLGLGAARGYPYLSSRYRSITAIQVTFTRVLSRPPSGHSSAVGS